MGKNVSKHLCLNGGVLFILLLTFSLGKTLAREEDTLVVFRASLNKFDRVCIADTNAFSSYCLTDGELANTFSPLWSPDKKAIAFISDHGGFLEVYVMDADGSEQRRLTEFQSPYLVPGLAWESNGRQIYIVSQDDIFQTTAYLVDLKANVCTLLTQLTSDIEINPSCMLSDNPILITLYDGSTFNIFSIGPKSSIPLQLTNTDKEAMYGAAQISPDQKYIALLKIEPDVNGEFSYESLNHPKLYLMKADGADLHYLADLNIPSRTFAWSPDSTKIAFSSHADEDSGVSVSVIGVHDSQPHQLTDGTTQDYFGDWSPDGQHIVFSRLPDAFANWQLYTMDSGGTNQQLIAECGRKECTPDW